MGIRETFDAIIADGGIFRRFVRGAENETVTTDGGPVPTLAKFIKDTTNKFMNSAQATSTTSLNVSTGEKTLVIEAGKKFSPGQWVTIGSGAASMTGTVVGYIGNTLTVDVAHTKSAGTFSAWTIGLSGPVGPAGAPGAAVGDLVVKLPWEA